MKFLKALSSIIQNPYTSFNRHNSELIRETALEHEREIGANRLRQNLINSRDFAVGDLLSQHQYVKTAVDIGSGAGWASAAVAKLATQVFAIEPSEAGIAIAKQLYPNDLYPNIVWHQGFAEQILPTLTLTTPTIFITGCVLSHLRDKEVEKISQAICAVAPTGSVFAFSECWSKDTPWHQHMWHVRTRAWWQAQFPEWTLAFGGTKHEQGDYHMGIWGVKSVGHS